MTGVEEAAAIAAIAAEAGTAAGAAGTAAGAAGAGAAAAGAGAGLGAGAAGAGEAAGLGSALGAGASGAGAAGAGEGLMAGAVPAGQGFESAMAGGAMPASASAIPTPAATTSPGLMDQFFGSNTSPFQRIQMMNQMQQMGQGLTGMVTPHPGPQTSGPGAQIRPAVGGAGFKPSVNPGLAIPTPKPGGGGGQMSPQQIQALLAMLGGGGR